MSELAEILGRARWQGWSLLPESEGFALLAALGLQTPHTLVFDRPDDLAAGELTAMAGDQVVLKAVCPDLAHKTEVRGIAVLLRDLETIRAAAREMESSLSKSSFQGFLLQERVDYDREVGGELLVSLRWDREFGPVLTCGPGGVHAELLGKDLKQDRGLMITSCGLVPDALPKLLAKTSIVELMTTSRRGRSPRVPMAALVDTLTTLVRKGEPLLTAGVDEIEINPLVAHQGHLIALDVLVRLSSERASPDQDRPIEKLRNLLEPRSIAILGVSRQLNPGRIILKNILREGFDPRRITVVKPGESSIEGCRCVPEIGALPERVDLLIIALSAELVPEVLDRVIDGRLAESLIVIPGGLEEQPGPGNKVGRLLTTLRESRHTKWRGPLINGANCLGIRSVPGHYDTSFLAEHKLPPPGGPGASVALVSQSGAFLAARNSKLPGISCKYSISIGNQLDLTVGDYLLHLAEDKDLRVIAVYIEGFKILDGLRFIEAARRLRDQGRTVVLYRAGRSEAGALAAASHTASLSGSYVTTIALARAAGVLIAESLADFEDLLELAARFSERPLAGRSLAGVSNAGFECVALSDHLGWWTPAELTQRTVSELRELLHRAGVDGLVEVRNPLDVTPMMGDEIYARVVEELLTDPGVDVGVIGCVPFTGALDTLPAGPEHDEDLDGERSIVTRLTDLWERTTKPWIVVVDAGSQYDPLAQRLRTVGIPTFRTMDRAMTMLEMYGRWVAESKAFGGMGNDQG